MAGGWVMKTGYAVGRPVVNAYLVRERDRRRWRDLAFVLLAVLPLGLALLSYTWIRLEVLRTGYRIDAMEHELEEVFQVERRLRLEASELASPALVEERAREELGMRPPALDQMLFLDQVGTR